VNANRHVATSDVHPWIRFWARSFERAPRCSGMVWAKGLGAGTPLLGQALMAAQHYELSANAKTFWDEEGGFEVQHGAIRGTRVIGAIAIALIVLLAAGLTLMGA